MIGCFCGPGGLISSEIHEYQGKHLPLPCTACPCPGAKVAYSVDEAVKAAKELGFARRGQGADPRPGGRGKGGRGEAGPHPPTTSRRSPRRCWGSTLHTHQTGPEGTRSSVACSSSKGMDPRTARRRCTSLSSSTARRPVRRCSWPRSPGGQWTIEEGRGPKNPQGHREGKRSSPQRWGFQAFQARKIGLRPGALPAGQRSPRRLAVHAVRCTRPSRPWDASLLEINPFLMTKRRDAVRAGREDHGFDDKRALPPPGAEGAAPTSTKRTRWRSRPRSSASTTSSSRAAPSAAW